MLPVKSVKHNIRTAPSRVARAGNLDDRNEGTELLVHTDIILGVDGSNRTNGNDRGFWMGEGDDRGSPPTLGDQIGGVGVVSDYHSENGQTNHGPTPDTGFVEHWSTSLAVQ